VNCAPGIPPHLRARAGPQFWGRARLGRGQEEPGRVRGRRGQGNKSKSI
jgi:hypothetical protein